MNTIEIKNNLHKLIDRIDNESVLSRFYEILEKASLVKDGSLWDRLTSEEKQELLQIDSETDSDTNLIPLQTIKDKHKKWLEQLSGQNMLTRNTIKYLSISLMNGEKM